MIGKYIKNDGKKINMKADYSRKILASEKLRCEISQEKDVMIMLEKSLLCISLMIDDSYVFYETNKNKVVDIIVQQQSK